MGYTTDFTGEVRIDPPLNDDERTFLELFATSRRMHRSAGPYFVGGNGDYGQGDGPDQVYDHNSPPPNQPGLWCQWVPNDDGTAIIWDEGEKFYKSEAWMAYLINHFLKPGAEASKPSAVDMGYDFSGFTFDHTLNGVIYAQGEDPDDTWRLVVHNNQVSSESPETKWPALPEGLS